MLKISDVMTREVFTLSASTPAETAAWELSVRGFTGAPVRDARGRLVGVLSRGDLADPERNQGGIESKEVQDLMTPALFTLEPSEPLSRAARLMVREGIGRVMVMDRGQLVGIVTSSDILSQVGSVDDGAGHPSMSAGARAARTETNFAPI
jgi:CBS domain-containing protein